MTRPEPSTITRRRMLATAGALTGLGAFPRRPLAADPVTVAAIYTVPVEQQWVSRIHKAAEAAVARSEKAGGASLAPLGTFEGKVPVAAVELVDERTAAIKSGDFVTKIDDAEPKPS